MSLLAKAIYLLRLVICSVYILCPWTLVINAMFLQMMPYNSAPSTFLLTPRKQQSQLKREEKKKGRWIACDGEHYSGWYKLRNFSCYWGRMWVRDLACLWPALLQKSSNWPSAATYLYSEITSLCWAEILLRGCAVQRRDRLSHWEKLIRIIDQDKELATRSWKQERDRGQKNKIEMGINKWPG